MWVVLQAEDQSYLEQFSVCFIKGTSIVVMVDFRARQLFCAKWILYRFTSNQSISIKNDTKGSSIRVHSFECSSLSFCLGGWKILPLKKISLRISWNGEKSNKKNGCRRVCRRGSLHYPRITPNCYTLFSHVRGWRNPDWLQDSFKAEDHQLLKWRCRYISMPLHQLFGNRSWCD